MIPSNLFDIVQKPAEWFMTLLSSTGTYYMYAGVLFMLCVFRFLIMPLAKTQYSVNVRGLMENENKQNRTTLYQNTNYNFYEQKNLIIMKNR